MSVVAVYNMKGGVGKTTTAVNLSYLAAADGQRVLLWDLDPQAASSFAFRVRPGVEGFRKKWIHSDEAILAEIRETDYSGLDLLPADFTHRKLERLLGRFSKPARVVAGLIETVSRDYDVVMLDCPPGFSLLTEGIFAASDLIVVPTIPAVLSLRMVTTLIEWAVRTESPSELVPFLSMVDRRKLSHRQICEWTAGQSGIFLKEHVPYASVVEQMTVRRAPLATFAPRDVASIAFDAIWTGVELRLRTRSRGGDRQSSERRRFIGHAIESLVARLESGEADVSAPPQPMTIVTFVHRFDTDQGNLQSRGCLLELREHAGTFLLVAATSDGVRGGAKRAEARIDRSWARSILSGAMSPLDALERRLGSHLSPLGHQLRAASNERTLRRVESRAADAGVPDAPSFPVREFEAAPDQRAIAGPR